MTLDIIDRDEDKPKIFRMWIKRIYLVSSSLIGILAQRLVRRICPDCKQIYAPAVHELRELGLGADTGQYQFYAGAGCDKCFNTGYRGRIGIYELMPINDKIREMILDRRSTSEIKRAAREDGMTFLRESAVDKVRYGVSTLKEINKVTFIEG